MNKLYINLFLLIILFSGCEKKVNEMSDLISNNEEKIFKDNIQRKCSINNYDTMDVVWEKISNCLNRLSNEAEAK